MDVVAGQCRNGQAAHQNPAVGLETVTILTFRHGAPHDQPGHQTVDEDRRHPDGQGDHQPPAVAGVVGQLSHHDRQTGCSHAGQFPRAMGMVTQRRPAVRQHIPRAERDEHEPGRQRDRPQHPQHPHIGRQAGVDHGAGGHEGEQPQRDIGIRQIPAQVTAPGDGHGGGRDHQGDQEHQTPGGHDAERVAEPAVPVVARADRQDSGRHHRGEHIG